MIELILGLVNVVGQLIKLGTLETKDAEAERQQLLHAQRLISDELMRRELGK